MANRVVEYVFKGNFTNLTAGLTAGGRAVGDFGNKLTGLDRNGAKMRAGLTQVGDTAGKLGLAASAGLALVTKAAMDWESAWAGVTKTVDGTPAQLKRVEDGLRDLARTMPASHREIAAVAEAAGQLGIQTDSIVSFTKTMLDLGATTNLTAEDAATAIAQMANVMGTAPDEVDNLGAALVALGNDGASTERQIIEMAQRISGAGAQIGLTEANVLAIANAAASMGVEVEMGGSAVSRVFSALARATSSGGPKLAEFARIAGLSADEFTRMFKEAPAEAFAAVTQGLDGISKSGGDVFTTLKGVGLNEQRVSDVLLRMAASGDLLTDSLELGNRAWRENTALAAEAEKRYATTESQARIAWNNITDAAIEFGDVALPVLAKAANAVADFAQAVGSTWGPVKSLGTSLLAVTAVLGGGLWFTAKSVNQVAVMRKALDDLGVSSARTTAALKGIGLATGAVIVLRGLADATAYLDSKLDRTLPGVEEMTKHLLAMDGRGDVRVLAKDVGDLGAALSKVKDPGFFNQLDRLYGAIPGVGKIGQELTSTFLGFGLVSRESRRDLRESQAAIELIDQSLTNIASSGGAERARATFGQLAQAYGLTKTQQEQLLDQMPQYREALDAEANAAKLSDSSTLSLTASQRDLAAATGKSADEIKGLIDAMREQRQEAIRAANAELNYKASLLDAQDALKENGATLDENTRAGQANQRALLDMAAAWNDQDATIKDGRGARKAAIDEFVRIAGQMGMNEKAARQYADSLYEIPERRVTKIDAQTGEAKGKVDSFKAAVEAIPLFRDFTLRVKAPKSIAAPAVTYKGNAGRPRIPVTRAAGGRIAGPGGPTDDLIPTWLSNGEYVIRASAVQKYGPGFFDMLNAERLAGGGQPGKGKGKLFVRDDLGMSLDTLGPRKALKQLERALERSKTAVDKERSARDDLVSRKSQLSSSVTDKLTAGLFDRAPGDMTWLSAADRTTAIQSSLFASLAQTQADSRAWQDAEQMLAAKGVKGDAFQALVSQARNPAELQAIAAMGQADISRYISGYASSTQYASAAGAFAGEHRFGAELATANVHLAASEAHNKALAGDVKVLTKEVKQLKNAIASGAQHVASGGKKSKQSSAAAVKTKRK